MSKLKNLKRCDAKFSGRKCGSPVFYDWGLELLDATDVPSITGGSIERWKNAASRHHVKICARCTTPYIMESGDLIDISEELGAEDVKSIITRGQATLPHPQRKDP